MREPPSLAGSVATGSPRRLRRTPLMVPRTVCACQPVRAVICSMVPPEGERSRAISRACLEPSGRTAWVIGGLRPALVVLADPRAFDGALCEVLRAGCAVRALMGNLLVRRRGIAA